MSILSKLQGLLTAANATTGESDTTLTDAMQTLVDGYGQGGVTLADVVNGSFPVGEIDLTDTTPVSYCLASRTGITRVVGSFSSEGQKLFFGCTGITSVNVKLGNSNIIDIFANCTGLTTAVVESVYGIIGLFNGCNNLITADLNTPQLRNNSFYNGQRVETIILRKSDSITALESTGAFYNTPFASGGTGGTLYVPDELIPSYQAANNWSTILGYANNSIVKIEGSIYETQYADGTPIT